MFGDAFVGRKAFVTGNTGFKGSWLSLWLSRLGAEVHGYSLPAPTQPSHFEAARVGEVLRSHTQSDIRDKRALLGALKAARPDVVFHLAAQPLVRVSYDKPYETFEINVMGSAVLLECIRALSLPCVVIIITSDKCYEYSGGVSAHREDDPLGGHDPYSASKAAAEVLVSSYRRSFFPIDAVARHGVKLASVRAGNVIGGGDWAKDRIVADCARCFSSGQTVPVRAPEAIRPWQHVLEPLGGYLTLSARMLESVDPGWCEAWNFGPSADDAITVCELVDRFCAEWKGSDWKKDSNAKHPHETGSLKLNIDKAVGRLGWRPRWTLDRAIQHTANWYKAYYAGDSDMQEVSLNDIGAYMDSKPIS